MKSASTNRDLPAGKQSYTTLHLTGGYLAWPGCHQTAGQSCPSGAAPTARLTAPLLHQLTLEVNQQATLFDVARRDSVRQQIITTTLIATLQFTLLFVLALLIWRQMNISFLQHKLMQQLNDKLLRANQAAEAGTRAKSSFLANMSHEIRTPMNGILGMLSLLADRDMDPRERDYLETARESANHLLGLLNDILDVSKLEEGKIELQLGPHHLPQLLEDIRALMQSSCDAKGITLTLTLSPIRRSG